MPVPSHPPAIFLMGPTASGKTALAVHLVERFPLEIVSVDSALVYRGMDIGTAKPDADTLARAELDNLRCTRKSALPWKKSMTLWPELRGQLPQCFFGKYLH